MILPDVNALVFANRLDASLHQLYADWLNVLVNGGEELALTDLTAVGFVRVVTNPRIFAEPTATTDALRFVHALRRSRRTRWVTATAATWNQFDEPDCWLAALATSHGCRLATNDRGFARFSDLDFFDPAA